MQPLVSVIIPVGPGHAPLLPTALASVQQQGVRGVETIVINDTGERLPHYHVGQWIDTAGRTGAGHARNAGIWAATAPLVFFLDADDYLVPRALEHLCRALSRYDDASYVYGDWYDVDLGGRGRYRPARPWSVSEWLDRGQHSVSALIPTEYVRALGGFDEDLAGWEDWDFYQKLAVSGICGVRVPAPTIVYRAATGFRRNASFAADADNHALSKHIRGRYEPYKTGARQPMGCCGGSNKAQQAARAAVLGLEEPMAHGETVRLEFVGQSVGSIGYRAPSGRVYKGGNNPAHRYVDAPADDAAYLLEKRVWRKVVRTGAHPQEPPPPPDPIPPFAAEPDVTFTPSAALEAVVAEGTEGESHAPKAKGRKAS